MRSYRATILACYGGNFTQAIIVNLTPLLFLVLYDQFGFTYTRLGSLVLINFITQVGTDLAFSKIVDRYGYRAFVAGGHFAAAAGLALFALSPTLAPNPYGWMVAATILFSLGGGLMELLLSPIVNAVPTDDKVRAMSLLHSFYAWGQATVVLATTAAIFLIGASSWPYFALAWAVVPLLNGVFFLFVPIAHPFAEQKGEGVRQTISKGFFACCIVIAMGGAAELSISQWSSALMERVVGLPKLLGDAVGMAGFAVMLGLGRTLHARYGARLPLARVLMAGSVTAVACYVVVSFTSSGAAALVACALCGMAVSLLWPGTLLLASEAFPRAGTWLFAFLAAGGDIGASLGPWLVGVVADSAPGWPWLSSLVAAIGPGSLGLRAGTLMATIFPLGAFAALLWLSKHKTNGRVIRRSRAFSEENIG